MCVKELIDFLKTKDPLDIPELEYVDESFPFTVSLDGFLILGYGGIVDSMLMILEDMRPDFELETCIRVKLC